MKVSFSLSCFRSPPLPFVFSVSKRSFQNSSVSEHGKEEQEEERRRGGGEEEQEEEEEQGEGC
ncbi:hypothetical protein EYF80_066874 [Liparis tanakae]|uniref:Uncharacterized protein n=1 Tax=Liparis tanakae TaxID=230148 RepID=A0A4Z2E2S6_9TELE|nr:hypothetical protein EYF80_066874 [Liparis tanakae]